MTLAVCERNFQDEGISGASTDRRAPNEAAAALAPGDVLATWKLDRLGRRLAHLSNVLLSATGRGRHGSRQGTQSASWPEIAVRKGVDVTPTQCQIAHVLAREH